MRVGRPRWARVLSAFAALDCASVTAPLLLQHTLGRVPAEWLTSVGLDVEACADCSALLVVHACLGKVQTVVAPCPTRDSADPGFHSLATPGKREHVLP